MARFVRLLSAPLLFLLLYAAGEASAQSYTSEMYGVEIGLPSYFTKAITQTPDRALWIATDAGVVRFNTRDVEVYQHDLLSPYAKNAVWLDSLLLLITDGGIQQVVTESGRRSLKTFLPGSVLLTDSTLYYPKGVFRDARGRLWVIEAVGMSLMEGERIRRFTFDPRFLDNYTYVANLFPVETPEGLFVITLTGYILFFDEAAGRFREVDFTGPGKRPVIRALHQTDLRRWTGAGENGLVELDYIQPGRFAWRYIDAGINATAVAPAGPGALYVASKTDGVYLYRSGVRPVLISELRNVGINSLYVDMDRNLWATCDQGFVLIQPQLFQSLSFPQSYQFTNHLTVAADGRVFAVSESGLFTVTGGAHHDRALIPLLSTAPSRNLSVFAGPDRLMVGNSDGVLLEQARNGSWIRHRITIQDPLSQAYAYYSVGGPDGSVWFLMYNFDGVFRWMPDGTFRHYAAPDGLHGSMNAVAAAPDGTIWVAGNTMEQYLYRFNAATGRFVNLSTPIDGPGEGRLNVHDMAFDRTGRLWMASNRGLLMREGERTIRVPGQDDFRFELFSAVAAASNGDIWVGAQNGVYLFRNNVFTQFNNQDGLPSLTVNYRCLRIDRDDRVWVGTINGVAYLGEPIGARAPTQPAGITSVRVNGRPVAPGTGRLEVREGSTVEVQFLSVGYPASKMEYQTRLVGLNPSWNPLQAADNVFYQQLPPGRYQFEVRAQRRGFPASADQMLRIDVIQSWYNTWQARSAYVLLAGALVWAFVLYRRKSEAQQVAEQKLRDTEQQLHTVFQSTPMIMFAVDRLGFVFMAEGKGFIQAGREPAGLIGQPVTNIFSGPEIEPMLSRVLSGSVVQGELQLDSRTFQLRMVPLSGRDGEPAGMLAVGDDLTERISMEKALIRAREEYRDAKNVAEKANQAKSMFLASMSHELRTPLNAIIGFAQILGRDRHLDERNREYVHILQRSGEHLLSMINDVLDLSKIEAGRMEIAEKLLDFHSLVQELKSMFELMAREKNLRFELHTDAGVPRFIETDEGKLRQILINLIGNAIKYTQEGRILISIGTTGGMMVVSVRDTGRGIPPDQLQSIFEPFRQVRGFNNKGTGLGLAISFRLAQLMQGRLEVDSEQGRGSDFRLYLPVRAAAPYVEPQEAAPVNRRVVGIRGGPAPLVHIVDDVQENRALLKALLEPAGFVCVEAENGVEAVELATSGRPDLILMDIVMPEMDGREAVRRIRAMQGFGAVPIIAVTASGFEDERRDLLRNGFSAYLRKPFRDAELYDQVGRLLRIEWMYEGEEAGPASGEPPVDGMDELRILAAAISALEPAASSALREAVNMMDLGTLGDLADATPLDAAHRMLIRREAAAANFRFFMLLDEAINGAA